MIFADKFIKFRARTSAWLRGRVAWVSHEIRTLDGSPFSAIPRVVILGREHYEERRKTYLIRSWRGIHAILKLELRGSDQTLFGIGPYRSEGREVLFFKLKPTATAVVEDAVLCIPETLLLSRLVGEGEILQVRRADFEYYVARGLASQIRGGAIIDSRLFSLSAGLPEDAVVRYLGEAELRPVLESAIRKLHLGDIWTFFVARERWADSLPWRQMGFVAALALASYLGLVSAYLQANNWIRERQISALGDDVDGLVQKQRDIESRITELKGIHRVADQRIPTYHLWEVLAETWRAGGAVTGVEMEGERIILRGTSSAATTVLAALSKLPQVKGAKFDAPVRSEFGQENFTIELTFTFSREK